MSGDDMQPGATTRRMTRRLREPANGLTHLAGVLLSLVALAALVAIGVRSGTASSSAGARAASGWSSGTRCRWHEGAA